MNVIYDRDYNDNNEIKSDRKIALKAISKDNGFKIDKEYLDYDKYNKGAKLKELLEDVKNNKIDSVIVKSTDRFTRNYNEMLSIYNCFKTNNVNLYLTNNEQLNEFEDFYLNLMKIFDQFYKKDVAKEMYMNKIAGKEISEKMFDTELKDKGIKLGYLLAYRNRGNIITETEDVLGYGFEDFSTEQLKVYVIQKEIYKDEEKYLNIVVDFAKEKDKELFADRLYPEYDDVEENEDDEEFEM